MQSENENVERKKEEEEISAITSPKRKLRDRTIILWPVRRLTLEHRRARRNLERESRGMSKALLHQTPSRRIALIFAARARDSAVCQAFLIWNPDPQRSSLKQSSNGINSQIFYPF